MIYRFLLCFSLILFFLSDGSGQELGTRSTSFSAGFNYSRLHYQGLKLKKEASPYLGMGVGVPLSNSIQFITQHYFSVRRSSLGPYYQLQKIGFDSQIGLQYQIDDMGIHMGMGSFMPVTAAWKRGNGAVSERNKIAVEQASRDLQVGINFGFSLKIVNHWSLMSNWHLPLGSDRSSNLQVGLKYKLMQESKRKESHGKLRRRLAKKRISQLREGVLLVRLKTSQSKIDALRRYNFHDKADQTEILQRKENQQLIQAFKQQYTFSEVRFFMSHHSKQVRNKNFEGIFVNEDLEIDSNIAIFNPKNAFVAEYALIENDTNQYFSHYQWMSTGNFAQVKVPVFYHGKKNNFMALVVKDQQFRQLDKPFPYYSRAFYKGRAEHPGFGFLYLPLTLFAPTNPNNCVENLNKNLFRFLEQIEQ